MRQSAKWYSKYAVVRLTRINVSSWDMLKVDVITMSSDDICLLWTMGCIFIINHSSFIALWLEWISCIISGFFLKSITSFMVILKLRWSNKFCKTEKFLIVSSSSKNQQNIKPILVVRQKIICAKIKVFSHIICSR